RGEPGYPHRAQGRSDGAAESAPSAARDRSRRTVDAHAGRDVVRRDRTGAAADAVECQGQGSSRQDQAGVGDRKDGFIMNVTQNVVTDLLPLYLAGEASDDTRALIEAYLKQNPTFAAEVREQAEKSTALRDALRAVP